MADDSIPMAIPIAKSPRRYTWLWWVTLLCGLVSVGLFWQANRSIGELIEIEFEEGHGLQPGDALRYRGIEVGRVEKIGLRESTPGVVASVRLIPNARKVVSDGTTFWIARPIVSFDAVRGLDTIIGPKYIAMEPGESRQSRTRRFQGLDTPPPIRPKEGSVEIILDSPKRFGLDSGTPILHRGFHVGDVLSVNLASDARSVLVRCSIDPEYHELVRSNSKFWLRSGWRVGLGLSGVRLEADSLSQVLYGGIEFATPDSKGQVIRTGSRFTLYEKPEDEWNGWKPSLPYGALWEKLQRQSPACYRTSLVWKQSSFGFQVTKQKLGWGLLFDDQTLFCREDFVVVPKGATAKSGQLEVAGISLSNLEPVLTTVMSDGSKMVRVKLTTPPSTSEPPLSAQDFLTASSSNIDELLIVGPETDRSVLIDKNRYTRDSRGLLLDAGFSLSEELDGAPVVDVRQGRWFGVVRKEGSRIRIATPTENR